MALHIFGHIETQQLQTLRHGELFRDFGFTHACWPCKEVRANRLIRLAQSGAGEFDRRGNLVNRVVLAKDHAFQIHGQGFEGFFIIARNRLWGDTRDFGNDGFDFFDTDFGLTFVFGHKLGPRARFVDHINRFIGQLTVGDVANREVHRALDSGLRIGDAVKFLEIGFQALQDFNGIRRRWLRHINFQKAARQRAVLFKMLTIFLIGR